MNKFSTMPFLALAAVALSPATASVYDFSYMGTGVAASGQITTNGVLDADGYSLITGLTGQRNGLALTLLATGSIYGNDNLFRSTFAFFNNHGLGFEAGGVNYNVFTSGGPDCGGLTVEASTSTLCSDVTTLKFTASEANAGTVPEPATWAMMVGGFGLVGASFRRRKVAVSFA